MFRSQRARRHVGLWTVLLVISVAAVAAGDTETAKGALLVFDRTTILVGTLKTPLGEVVEFGVLGVGSLRFPGGSTVLIGSHLPTRDSSGRVATLQLDDWPAITGDGPTDIDESEGPSPLAGSLRFDNGYEIEIHTVRRLEYLVEAGRLVIAKPPVEGGSVWAAHCCVDLGFDIKLCGPLEVLGPNGGCMSGR